ncbi:MAG TPA: Gfo/Idh/MocA family oxidoreductase [Candidatus Lokiarchaeia archaeon]|nr:Gfo/Idh/MocA family oxidoreductase [Candidatus Lokiarchaeia archaeon]
MQKVLKLGLIGAGTSATNIATVASALPEVELLAIADTNLSKAQELTEKLNIPDTYDDAESLLARDDIEAVIISVPHFAHHPIVMKALDAGKHVLVEKPIATNLRDTDEMIATARQAGLKLGVFLQNRFSEASLRMKEAIDSGVCGTLVQFDVELLWTRDENYYAESPWRGKLATEGGGCLINQAIHTIDLMCMLAGDVEFLFAQVGTYAHAIEVEDHALALLKFKNGALGCIRASTATIPGFPDRLTVIGTQKTLQKQGDMLTEWDVGTDFDKGVVFGGIEHASFKDNTTISFPNHIALITDFIHAVLEDRDPMITGEVGRQSLEVIRAIYASSEGRQVVSFPFNE